MDMYDMVQRNQIGNTSNRVNSVADQVHHQAKRTGHEIDALEERLERMRTLCDAMWQLLCETTGLTDAHLAYRLYELDIADGERDGTKKLAPKRCTGCQAMVSAQLKACQFCGAAAPERGPWDSI